MRVTNRRDFEESMSQLSQLAATDRRLPDQVFRFPVCDFHFMEFCQFATEEFWMIVRRLARQAGDTRITVAVLDPDPAAYFFEEFGEYGVVLLGADDSAGKYYDELSRYPPSSRADSLDINSELLTWFGDQGRWLIWGERSEGVAVLGCREPMHLTPADAPIPLLSAVKALNDLIRMEFRADTVPDGWKREFLSNYQK